MNIRLKELRKKLGYTQNEFGEKIGITGATISDIEKGKRNLTERNVSLICLNFNVNEKWLRSGSGKMFVELTEDEEISEICAKIIKNNDEDAKHLLRVYWKASDDDKLIIKKIINVLAENK